MIRGRVKKVKIVFMLGSFLWLRNCCLIARLLVDVSCLSSGLQQIVGFDPESQRSDGGKNEQISDEHFSLYIERGAENVSKYDSEKSKQTK